MQKSSIDDAVVGDVSDRGLQFSDNDHAIGNSVESCKDGSKSQNCPERSGMMQLEVPEIGKNDYNVCKLFYDTSTGDDASTGGIKRMTEAILVEILERLEISHKLITLMLTVVLLRQLIRCFMWTRMIRYVTCLRLYFVTRRTLFMSRRTYMCR
ncbi:hypothetical protein Bca4012_061267 [Brassica carinata]